MQIKMKGYSFDLTEPFAEGSLLTKGEAQAMNRLRAENISNNLRPLVTDAIAGLPEGELISAPLLVEIQSKLTNYDLSYQFLEQHQPRARVGDIEAEAWQLAAARVDSQIRESGGLPEETPGREALIAEMERLPAVVEEARQLVGARRRALAGGLDSL